MRSHNSRKLCCSNACSSKYTEIKKIQRLDSLRDPVECKICRKWFDQLCGHLKAKHGISLEEYKQKFPGAKIQSSFYTKELSRRWKGKNNPGYRHNGTLSPFSDKFVNGYDPTIHERKKQTTLKNREFNNPNTLNYYLHKGYSNKEAIELRKQYKNSITFSLENCIKKYGEKEGTKKFNSRQIKWQATLNSKSPEEIADINKRKIAKGYSISKAEKEIQNFLLNLFEIESQYVILKEKKSFIYDIAYKNKIIEYHGDYWHCNPKKYPAEYFNRRLKCTAGEKWIKDQDKLKIIKDAGFDVLVIWEYDYKKNKEKILQDCVCFLNS